MKAVVATVFLFVAVALASGGNNFNGNGHASNRVTQLPDHFQPDPVVNPANWHGTWSANNRYGGVMYACPKGDYLYGVYSNAGFFIGQITDRTVEGTWYEGGRGDRNDWQGSFRIELSDDNQEFDGFYYRVTEDGAERRWHEYRMGAPYPSNPSDWDCLVPSHDMPLTGQFYRDPSTGFHSGAYYICKDEWEQIYGSFYEPEGYIEGWSVDRSSGFHGYRYDSNGLSGAYILRAVSRDQVRGFYWRGRLATQNIETSTEEVLNRSAFTVALNQCEAVGNGFLERLRGPDRDNSSMLSANLVGLLAIVAAFFAFF